MRTNLQAPSKVSVECHELSTVELMQRFIDLCQSGHHGSTASKQSAEKALEYLSEIVKREKETH